MSPAGAELSITQLEYEEAKRRHIDVLPFLLDDDADGWTAEFDQLASDERLRKWLADVKEHHVVQTFKKTPSTLQIAPALTRWVKETGPKVALRLYLDCVQQEHGFFRFVSLPRVDAGPTILDDRPPRAWQRNRFVVRPRHSRGQRVAAPH